MSRYFKKARILQKCRTTSRMQGRGTDFLSRFFFPSQMDKDPSAMIFKVSLSYSLDISSLQYTNAKSSHNACYHVGIRLNNSKMFSLVQ